MYERYYGLRERPFELTPNPAFLYLSHTHREALANVEFGISGAKGITVLVGEAGTGKTTVVHAALRRLSERGIACVSVNNPTLRRAEFYEFLASSFRLTPQASGSKARFLLELMTLVGNRHRAGHLTALVIDEAQSVPFELLEEVRLLANLETSTAKLLPVVLVGQPELSDRLEQPRLRQLKQRVALRCELEPLNLKETANYVAARIRQAGGDVTQIFTPDAMFAIFCVSSGIPRTISVVCDNALVAGFALDARPIGPDVVAEVCKELHLAYTAPLAVPPSWLATIRVEPRAESALASQPLAFASDPVNESPADETTAPPGRADANDSSIIDAEPVNRWGLLEHAEEEPVAGTRRRSLADMSRRLVTGTRRQLAAGAETMRRWVERRRVADRTSLGPFARH